MRSDFNYYFEKPDVYGAVLVHHYFCQSFVTLWPGWLGKENLYLLDQVTRKESARFNLFLLSLHQAFGLLKVDLQKRQLSIIRSSNDLVTVFEHSMSKSSNKFHRYVVPELEIIVEESWDHTYVVWSRNYAAIERLRPFVKRASLFVFDDASKVSRHFSERPIFTGS